MHHQDHRLFVKDTPSLLTQKVVDVVENSREKDVVREGREDHALFTLTLENEQSKSSDKAKRGVLPEAEVLPSRNQRSNTDKKRANWKSTCSKNPLPRKRRTATLKSADLKTFGEQTGEFRTKTGEKAMPKTPEKITGNIWDEIDFEPGDDVPLVMKPGGIASSKTRRAAARSRAALRRENAGKIGKGDGKSRRRPRGDARAPARGSNSRP